MNDVDKTTQRESQSALQGARAAIANAISVIWRFLVNPLLLLAVSGLALALVMAAMFVPQMPHPYNSDPAAATRWLVGVTASYGAAGSLLESLGLFNLQQSTLLRLLLVLVTLMLTVQLANHLGIALAMRRLTSSLKAPAGVPGTPVSLPYSGKIYRFREAAPNTVDELVQFASTELSARFGAVQQASVPMLPRDDADTDPLGALPPEEQHEARLLAQRYRVAAYLRPLLLFGLLAGILGIWLNTAFGWEVISSGLSPTERYQYPPRDLELYYPAIIEDDGAAPAIRVSLGDADQTVAVGDAGRVGSWARVVTEQSMPALLVRAEPSDAVLVRPGEPVFVDPDSPPESAILGLAFPEPGSEETLVLPNESMGVRIVRRPENVYSIEVYTSGSSAPVDLVMLDSDESRFVDLPKTDVALEFYPSIGAVIAVRSAPGNSFFWLAGALVIAGLLGFVRNPAFLFVQASAWTPVKRVVAAQSNASDELADLRLQLQPVEKAEAEAEEN